jgi:NAD(P)-dependent dehydrogenase (short-subunit alcohol dehydrogenase family)
MKYIIPLMRKAGGGSIINISSIYGLIGSGTSAAYQATKGGVRLLTKTAAIEYVGEKIRVNSIHPGFIDTPMVSGAITPEALTSILSLVPMKRLGSSLEIANGALFLASDESSYMTGSELVIDGGYTCQ